MSNFRLTFRAILPAPAPTPSAPSYPQRTPIHRRLIPPTDLYYDARWAAQRAMDAPRAKRTRASVNYAEPTELDDDIDEPTVPASDDHSSDAEIVASDTESDSGSDEEFTTDKRKIKTQQKKKAAKKSKKKAKKIKDVPFPFMELPLEIRFMIYKACLVESARDLSYTSKSSGREVYRGHLERSTATWGRYRYKAKRERRYDANRTTLQPVILRINKAIREEAIHYLYAQTFHFSSRHAFQLWFARISPANRMLLKSIVIRGWTEYKFGRGKDVHHVFSLLSSATGIRSIVLDRHVWSENDTPANSYRFTTFTGHPASLWRDIEYWADAIDTAQGKGAAKAALKFTKLCFGSVREIEQEDEAVEKRENDFMAQLKFSEKAEQ